VAAGDADGRLSATALEEVWDLELSGRIPGLSGLAERAYAIFTPLLAVTDLVVRQALLLDAGGLGANDRIHAATCFANDIEAIVTADAAFDAVRALRRVDPLDERSRRRLLRS
jgi:predicted nucleic acid-binding protein